MSAAKLRVAQVVLSLEPGGTEKLVVDLVARLSSSIECRVYCLDAEGEFAAAVRERGIPVDVVGRRPGFDVRVAVRLAALARAHDVDVLHCHQYTPFVYGRLAAIGRRGPSVVFTEHGRLSDAPPSWRRRAANLVLGRLPERICAVSADLRRFMAAEALPASRIMVVHNGIDPGPAPDTRRRQGARESIGLRGDAFVVGTAARLDPVKNLDLAISAFAAATNGDPTARLVIAGDGPERERLEAAARAQGIGNATMFLGYRPDVRDLLPALDLFVNTSITEGMSVTILEAMAAGVPILATAVGGTPEILTDGVEGALVPAGDVEALSSRLRWFAGHACERAAMAVSARSRLVDAFTAERMADRYLALYRSLTCAALPARSH